MATHRPLLTYADYAALPDDGRCYELHEGELSVTPSPGTAHQQISGNLNDVLRPHVKQHALGLVVYAPLDVILADHTVVQPDLWTRVGGISSPPAASRDHPCSRSRSSRRALLVSIA